MKNKKRHQKWMTRAAMLPLAMLLLVSLAFSCFAQEQEKPVLRVGYLGYQGFIAPDKSGEIVGYGVDYLNEIAKYTGFSYEFVHGSWADNLEKLENQEIDLVCTAKFTAERAQNYDYSGHRFGTVEAVLYTAAENDALYYDDFANFSGMTVGFLTGSLNRELFADYAEQNGFSYTEAFYASDEEMAAAVRAREIDAIATEQLARHDELKLIGNFGSEPFYLMSWKGSPYLKKIDNAISQINLANDDFEATLNEQYYGQSKAELEPHFTREEAEYIAAAPTLRVAVNSEIPPMAYSDPVTGELVGINVGLLDLIAQSSGLRFAYLPLPETGVKYEYEFFRENKVDLISGIEVNEFNQAVPSLALTQQYFTTQKSMVGRRGERVDPASHCKIALAGGSGTLPYLLEKEFPNFEILTYTTINECLEAVRSKEADVLFYNQYLLSKHLDRPQYDHLVVVPGIHLPESIALSPVLYAQADGKMDAFHSDPRLISILNKAIAAIPEEAVERIVIEHTVAQPTNLSLRDVLYKYRAPLVLVAILLLLCILLFLFLISNRQRHLARMRQKNEQLAQAVEQADRANRAKSQFLSRMSHEIRTPMNAIVGITAIAKSHLQEPERTGDYLDKISSSCKILLNIINDVLDMSAIENEKLKIAHNPFDLKSLLSGISSLYYAQCKQKRIRFEMNTADVSEEMLVGDALRVNQILLNLLSNACKFTPEGGEIKVTVSQTTKKEQQVFLRFVVADTGEGISDELKERLFQPFEQETAQTAQKHGGSGLGLSITKNLVELMQGAITVESEKGKGTTFIVDLGFELADQAGPLDPEAFHDVRALIVDDDAETREYTSLVMDRIGVGYELAESGEEAVRLLTDAHRAQSGYDICFVDWKMPGMNGLTVTRKIRELFDENTVIIIVSAYDLSEIEDEAKAAGANMFVPKPLFQSTVFNLLMGISGGKYTKLTADEKAYDFTGKKVLLAEDNALNREIATELLRMVGMQVETAEDGKQAVEQFAACAPGSYDAILMDVQMPVMDGHEAARAIRALAHPDAKRIPIFAMTANAFTEDVTAALAAGMNGHIAKPIDTAVLYETLDNCMNREK